MFTIDASRLIIRADSAWHAVVARPAAPRAELEHGRCVHDPPAASRTSRLIACPQGARALVRLATADDIRNGQHYDGLQSARANAQACDAGARDRLRRLSETLTRRFN
jgi:hypothetical protein